MNTIKKLVVFYRDYSTSLEAFLAADSALSFSKDGAQTYLNHKVPRLSVFVSSTGDHVADKKRLRDLNLLLDAQVKLGLIISYT